MDSHSLAHQCGCKIYDFLGVASDFNPNSTLYGMYKFKRGFNPEVVEFIGEYDMVLNKGMYLFWNLAEPLYLKALVNLGKLQLLLKKNLSRRQNCDPAVE
nr:peptidoglycan bridge formation glycyltransferase FemA/FemB family protein [Desulforamulus aquiferis]